MICSNMPGLKPPKTLPRTTDAAALATEMAAVNANRKLRWRWLNAVYVLDDDRRGLPLVLATITRWPRRPRVIIYFGTMS